MRRIIGQEVTKLCEELCQRLGDMYEGPYFSTIKGNKIALTFWGKKGSYTAIPTPAGLSVQDEKGMDIALYTDITDITF